MNCRIIDGSRNSGLVMLCFFLLFGISEIFVFFFSAFNLSFAEINSRSDNERCYRSLI